jgi:SAM-dependent methyltransferase
MKVCPRCAGELNSTTWLCQRCDWQAEYRQGFIALAPELADGGGGFDPAAFQVLASLEHGNFWFRARNKLILWTLGRWQPTTRRHLEVGCGTGYVLAAVRHYFPQARITGSEIFSVGLPHAARRVSDIELLQMDARSIPYVDEFDSIGAFDVIEHIQEDELVLQEMTSALRPGGVLLLTVPQHRWLWSAQDELAHHVRRYTAAELRGKVLQAGLRIEFETSFVSLLLPLMALSRWRQRERSATALASCAELNPPKWIGWSLERVMDIERLLITAGIRFPVGGSRFIVARKPRAES